MFNREALRVFRLQKYPQDQLTEDGLHRLNHNTSQEQRRMHFLSGLFPPRLHKKINDVLNNHKNLISDFVGNIGFKVSNEEKLVMAIGAFGVGENDKPVTDPKTLVEFVEISVGQLTEDKGLEPIIDLTYDTNIDRPSIRLSKEGRPAKIEVDEFPIFMNSLVELAQGLSTYMPELRQRPRGQ